MNDKTATGWKKLMEGYPWFDCQGCFPITAYSEFMPPPRVGCKPYSNPDERVLNTDDPHGWYITEMEEEYELRPGIEHIGHQVMDELYHLGSGLRNRYIGGHNRENLRDNPYWPPELEASAGKLSHERFISLISLMLSRTQDDKGRVVWTLFGNSIHEPEISFWKNFYTAPDTEKNVSEFETVFKYILKEAYRINIDGPDPLFGNGFRIDAINIKNLPSWANRYVINDFNTTDSVKYLLTFRPFSLLHDNIKKRYLDGSLALIPFPGSLVFWGMPGYNKLSNEMPSASQIPLLHTVARNRGIGGIRVPQCGWFHEDRPDKNAAAVNELLLNNTFHRTHRWQRVHKYQDELNEAGKKDSIIRVLFSTEPDALGLYDKPLAPNSQIWNDKFELILDGPSASRRKVIEAEKMLLRGGLFGYRFFYPPMNMGRYEIYLNRPLVGFYPEGAKEPVINPDLLHGYISCYHNDDLQRCNPLFLWPRLRKRNRYLSAVRDFETDADYYSHQTALNIVTLLESYSMTGAKQLPATFAEHLLNTSKHRSLEEWLNELDEHCKDVQKAGQMCSELKSLIDSQNVKQIPEALTFNYTATRKFEEEWWNDIRFLAQGEFVYKDNADIMLDDTTLALVKKEKRDLEALGDYLISRYKDMIRSSGASNEVLVGELAFKWNTLFDFSLFGGWLANQEGKTHERNILVVIPGRNRSEAVVFGDHYDTAYMEDIYDKDGGGSGARLAARGADDNYSATSTLLQAAPIFMKLSKEGKLERDIWLLHLTGEEFPSDCMGARNFCQSLIEKRINLRTGDDKITDLSNTRIKGVYIMDMIGHNRDNDKDIFQISPGKSNESLMLAYHAHVANMLWNETAHHLNHQPERLNLPAGKRITGDLMIPPVAKHLALKGEVRTQFNPHSSIFNTDGQIFSDVGIPVVLFMENYDISRSGYHDTKDTLENIDLDYGSAFAAIAIETVARIASITKIDFC